MELPVELSKTLHKHGGIITRITRIAHEAVPPKGGRSQDIWHFIGDVTWHDGGNSVGIEIAPWAVCALDGSKEPEVGGLMELLEAYLVENGQWFDRDSKHEGWYANERPQVRRRA